ncbi:MAG: hypothetical protein JST00_28930 [Deltaproteobacteria bacterium]|nr:hypothetical protein [Deltaproteobacteria bacterium]
MTARVRLERWPADDAGPSIRRGTRKPRAIAWYGFSAFWGHLRHLVASVIATENIDSRQWMIPEAPDVLLGRVLEIIGPRATRTTAAATAARTTLAEAMGGEVWIDFVADTGDDVTVSEVVAELFSAEYEVPDPDDPSATLVLPRGDILFLGGDLAYPVATVLEMTRRLLTPWNRVLEQRMNGAPRVLLAVPGNHDWYDGLDGFSRLCQAPCAFEDPSPVSDAHHPNPEEHPVLAWAEAFARGDQVKKPSALALAGYLAVQRASYFRFPLAPGIDLFAVDRQLKRVDPRQQAYFAIPGAPAKLVVVPDPARAWGEARLHGTATLESLGIDMATSPTLLLAGDIHHYERSREGKSIHVVAGGGGAFLQGSRIAGDAAYPVEAEFPGAKASWRLLLGLPLHCALGRAGLILNALFAVGDAVALQAHVRGGYQSSTAVSLAISLIVAFGTALLVGWRRHRILRVVPFAAALGLAIGAVPVAIGIGVDSLAMRVIGSGGLVAPLSFLVALALSTFASSYLFGAMLMLIARLGLNHAQAYAAMGSPGYKHIVRLRVRATGSVSHVDAFVIGVVDPVTRRDPVLVDTFRFDPFASQADPSPEPNASTDGA